MFLFSGKIPRVTGNWVKMGSYSGRNGKDSPARALAVLILAARVENSTLSNLNILIKVLFACGSGSFLMPVNECECL